MQQTFNTTPAPGDPADQQALRFVEKIFGAARASAVYSEPVTNGAYTVITASEVIAGGGFGSGHGTSPVGTATTTTDAANPAPLAASGGGSGGGGGSSGRPVAVIVVGPDGVHIKPIFDVTKFGLAALTAWVALLGTFLRLQRGAKGR